MAETLTQRATRYFSLEKEPRRSVLLGNGRVVFIARDRVWLYDEFYGYDQILASSFKLTEKRRDDLVEALERWQP